MCKYNDCGWCYAPEDFPSNDTHGQCNNMIDCVVIQDEPTEEEE
ncbi:hypothetical protein KUA24_127 [Vibrio phage HNL01]|nr:hypothetical protein KUA24_127 [Vibrio phage HNL01]